MAEKLAKRGDKGGHIATLNAVLFKKGYKKVPNPGDPKAAQEFTVETEKAVKDVQKKYGLKPTGMCDPAGVIYALGKKPADFQINPFDHRAEAKKYTEAQAKLLKRIDQAQKDLSDEKRAMEKRLADLRSRASDAIKNDFTHAVNGLEWDYKMFQISNDFIQRAELIKSIKKWEKKAEVFRDSAKKENDSFVRYVKEIETVVRQLKSVAK